MDPKTYEQASPAPIISNLPPPPVPLLPQHIITSGTRKDCIRLRGLPYEAHVEHILEFLGDHAKNIVLQGVHMVYNAQVSCIMLKNFFLILILILTRNYNVNQGREESEVNLLTITVVSDI